MKSPIYSWSLAVLSLTFFLLAGCNSGERPSIDEKYLSFLSEMNATRFPVIIVPTRGCGPCIKAAMDFLRDSTASSEVSVIISGPTEKSCALLLKRFNVQRGTVLFDIGTRAHKVGITTIYPVLLSLKDDELQVADISPDNYAALRLN